MRPASGVFARADVPVLAPPAPIVYPDLLYSERVRRPLRLDLYRPNTRAVAPAILLIPGGGWRWGKKEHLARRALALAERGYVAAAMDYTPSTIARFPAAIDDCKRAIQWLREEADFYHIDRERIGALGPSGGGYLALMLAFTPEIEYLDSSMPSRGTPVTIRAACSWFGPTDLTVPFPDPVADDYIRTFVGPDASPAAREWASPTRRAIPETCPVMLIHGDEDHQVPLDQSVRLFDRLKHLGAPCEFHTVSGLGHEFKAAGDRSVDETMERIRHWTHTFFDRCLR